MESSVENITPKYNGANAVAEPLRIDIASVCKWTYPNSKGGTNGLFASTRQRDLLEKARAADIDLRPDDFFAFSDPAPRQDGGAS